jgi:hypothetical protein
MLYRNFNDTQAACDKCALRQMEICPYLEEVANCHMFKELEGRPGLFGESIISRDQAGASFLDGITERKQSIRDRSFFLIKGCK